MANKEHTFADLLDYLIQKDWGGDTLSATLDSLFCNIGKSFIDLKTHFKILTQIKTALTEIPSLCEYKNEAGMIVLSFTGRVLGCFIGASRLSLSP